VKSKVSWCET